jgi:tripartite-type tricarboxylate transporter receptor subunit TctC
MVSAFAPGGTTDVLARLVGEKLREAWGQPVVVDNRPGAGGNIGTDLVAKAPPDGYTLLMGATGILAVNLWLFEKLPYDPRRDFAPVVHVASAPLVVVVAAGSPLRSIGELIAAAKKPGAPVTFASAGPGSPQHITGELFKHLARVPMTHVPYKSAGLSIVGVLGGESAVSFEAMIPALPHVKSGKLRAIGVTSARPVALLPGVPPVAEAGVPGFESVAWYGIVAPAGTPAPVIKKLNTELVHILTRDDMKQRLADMGNQEVVAGPPEAFGRLMREETAKWGAVVKAAGIRLD